MKIFALDPLDLPIFYNLLPESLLHDVPAGAFLVGCGDGERRFKGRPIEGPLGCKNG